MKNKYKKVLLGCSTALFSVVLPASAESGVVCSPMPDCTSLGYIMSEEDCTEDSIKVACPTNTSKFFCKAAPVCPAVVVGEYDTCTKYCETDSSVCIEKAAISCEEFVEKNNGILVAQSLPPLGTMENYAYVIKNDLYLLGEVKDWTTQYERGFVFDNINIYDAGEAYAECKELMQSPDGASLYVTGDNFRIANSVSFHVPADVKITHDESMYPAFKADFWKTSKVFLDIAGALREIEWPKITFHGDANSPEAVSNLVYMSCGPYIYNAGSEKTSYCGADIAFNDTAVDVCQSMEECYKYTSRWCSWRGSCIGGRKDSSGQWEDNVPCDFTGEACSLK